MLDTMKALIGELEAEAAATRRVLERVPNDKLTWKPHPKSMSLGQLAFHVAKVPGEIIGLLSRDGFDATNAAFEAAPAASAAELLLALDKGVAHAKGYLAEIDAASAAAMWTLTSHGKTVLSVPRAALIRSLMFNHWYHHRGQLTVYLRLLDIPVPATYGRSADEGF